MATRERKATRSNTDSPTISNSSSRSDTASPVTVGRATKVKTEATTPVRNPLRSTRAGSVAQSQSGSPPDASLPPPATDEAEENSPTEDTKNTRQRPTRQTTAAAAADTEDKTASGRGVRKPVAPNVHPIKRNSLPVTVGRAAKMSTRRNSSGKMEAILKVCAEDDAGALVSKPKRGLRGTGNSSSQQAAVVTPTERRTLLRRKRALSADAPEAKDEAEMDEVAMDEQEVDEDKGDGDEAVEGGRRRSIDSVASKCSEVTDTQSLFEAKNEEAGDDEEELDTSLTEDKEQARPRGRPVGRKRKRGGNKRNSPTKKAAADGNEDDPPVVKVKTEDQEEAEDEDDAEQEEKTKSEIAGEESEKTKSDDESESVATAIIDSDSKDTSTKVNGKETKVAGDDKKAAPNGELTIKVESDEAGAENDGAAEGEKNKAAKDSSPSPSLPAAESLSPVSVQQMCGQPAFLENNPGIEKDPKVAAEMGVQVQEKIQASSQKGDNEAAAEEKMDTNDEESKENQNHENVRPQQQQEDEKKVDGETKETKTVDKSPPPLVQIKKEPESPECSRMKENHLKTLGLLTLRAADHAKQEKARRREILKAFPTPPSLTLQQLSAAGDSDGGGSGSGKSGARGNGNQEYTGTLKTVIKLNRKNGNGSSKTGGGGGGTGQGSQSGGSGAAGGGRQSLKMTFQKGRGKGTNGSGGSGGAGNGGHGQGKDSRQSASEGEEYYTISKEGNYVGGPGSGGSGGTDCGGSNHSGEDGAGKEEKDLVIPEKAASFSIHPDRLCQDQCFYCGGKFGLFDTPLHIAQIKSAERQKKILDNEEKLTADSCLCDACYRHVDRRANCPSYKKRLSGPSHLAQQQQRQQEEAMDVDDQQQQSKTGDAKKNRTGGPNCSLCRSKISKNRSFPLQQNVKRLEDMIRSQGIAVQWGITPVVCKLCKLYTEHLTKEMRGEASETSHNSFAENYRRRLISFYKSEEAHRKKQRQEQQARNNQQQNSAASSAAMDSSEASRALSRNPAISIRELFPGEDEMGLSVHLPFGQAGGIRTPEGWTRSYSLLQYDDQTRQLWEELQRPYGNQSSFIRHLVLLEKYFRNGDLVLSKNASSSAATYSESVQTRLQSFDSSVSLENRTLLNKLSNAPITITQKPKAPSQALTITPAPAKLPSPPPLVPTTASITTKSKVEAGTSLLKKSVNSLPPDLISISTSSSATTTTSSTASPPSTAAAAASQATEKTPTTPAGTSASSAATTASSSAAGGSTSPSKRTGSPSKPRETVVVTLPDTLSPQDRKLVNGKSWRPTLMPVEKIELNEDGTRTMFKTADGRLLPSRVQVMSGGKPYHISIYDYNRMCILRREKLLQKGINGQKAGEQSSSATTAAASSSSSSSTATSPPKGGDAAAANGRLSAALTTTKVVAAAVQIPNTVLEQNSFVPVTASGVVSVAPINGTGGSAVVNGGATTGTTTRRNSRSSAAKGNSSSNSALSVVNLGSQITATVTKGNSGSSGEKEGGKVGANHNWMWNPGDMSMDQQTTTTSLDSSASAATASLLSRIPKSLTVIPQQKLM